MPVNASDSRNLYVESELSVEKVRGDVFSASEACAEFETESPTGFEAHQYSALKNKPVDAEIDINRLPPMAKQLFQDPLQNSRKIEWDKMISQSFCVLLCFARVLIEARLFLVAKMPYRKVGAWSSLGVEID